MPAAGLHGGPYAGGLQLRPDEVRVIREEAVGMYEVAVLAAGGAEALARWMTDHGFRYPDGMEAACEEYIAGAWCFVAVKARVGNKAATDPRPGMREVDPGLRPGDTFDGHVQAMGFRFRTDELVVPMRLSAFNEGRLYNVLYVLTDGPVRASNLDEALVLRQVRGSDLLGNVTEPLPLVVRNGTEVQIPERRRAGLAAQRDPAPHNGLARELFASDLLAARTGHLAHAFEEREKSLLDVGEALGLRGHELDELHRDALAAEVEEATRSALRELRDMTLSVIEGDFPRDVLAAENLTFERFRMPSRLNTVERYRERERPGGAPFAPPEVGSPGPVGGLLVVSLLALALAVASASRRRRLGATLAAAAVLVVAAPPTAAQELRTNRDWIERLAPPESRRDAVAALVARGEAALPDLVHAAKRAKGLATRGWAVVCLGRIGTEDAARELAHLQRASSEPELVRTWAAAARVPLARDAQELAELSREANPFPAVSRPLARRWNEVLGDASDGDALDELLDVCDRNSHLEDELVPLLLELDPDVLARAAYRVPSDRQRRRCAAYLATVAQGEGRGHVAEAVLHRLEFDPAARFVAWRGGALYLPAIEWKPVEARRLIRALLAWLVMCDCWSLDFDASRVRSMLANVGLFRAAGLDRDAMDGYRPEDKLYHWGRAVGIEEVRSLLVEQGLEAEEPYRGVLERLAR